MLTNDLLAWTFGFKGGAQYSNTDNVNASSTDRINDSFNDFDLMAQAKTDAVKIKIKGKVEKYTKETANDFYSSEGSLQYKPTKANDYNISVYKLVYNNTPAISSDTSSDNQGAKISTNFNNTYDQKTSSVVSFVAAYKNYPILGRKDNNVSGLFGLEYLSKVNLTISPDFSINLNSSNQDYYKNYAYGPSLYLSYTPSDKWEYFSSMSYTYTKYIEREVITTLRGKTVRNKEFQSFLNLELGGSYYLTDIVTLQAKFAANKNTSNNSASAYKSNVITAGISLRY
jgi:hypothetical protein